LTHPDADATDDFFEMSLDNLCVVGFDGYFRRLNPSWTRTLGWSAEELLARPVLEFVHPDDQEAMLSGRGRLHSGGELGPLINRYRCKDGTFRWFEWRSVAHADRGLVYAAARDITEQRLAQERLSEAKGLQEKLERQLVFADRMASVGTLAAGVAHEVNNPLAYVAANLALILEELDREPPPSGSLAELREMVVEARQGAERIRKIVHGLKTFARGEEERRAVIDVRPVLELAINLCFHEIRPRSRLVKDYGKTPLVLADDARLGQVFVNLLVNAAQAITAGDSSTNEIRVVTRTDVEGRAVVEIRDSGAGIPPAVRGRIFDPFFTTKLVGVGSGLGLSICHNIVTRMGGEISVVSAEGSGTTFSVALPAAVPLPAAPALAVPARPSPSRAVVLVVDDEPAVGQALRRVLRDHDVTVVTRAQEALELLRAGKFFDVILSDLTMPSMSGMAFYDELTRTFPAAAERVVFVSGASFAPGALAFLLRSGRECIEKPFDPKRVREVVQRFVPASDPTG
jgi:two-component system cell cycle sensor histidine kinase/response regulator CckA